WGGANGLPDHETRGDKRGSSPWSSTAVVLEWRRNETV
ncbi:MAG: hypothetical protein FD138_2565, partial [Planctomycetota bacterium]